MRLANTTSNLEVYLGEVISTTNPQAYADNYTMQFSGTSGTLTSHTSNRVNFSGTTPVVLVAAPASGYEVQINRWFITNIDTIAHTIFVRINDNSTTYTYFVDGFSLAANQTLQYIEGRGISLAPGGGS